MARKPKEIVVVGSKVKEVVKEAAPSEQDGFEATKLILDNSSNDRLEFRTVETQSPIDVASQVLVTPGPRDGQTDPQAALVGYTEAPEDDGTASLLPEDDGFF